MEEALIKRVMPHSVEAEQSVVGAMLMDKDAITTASEIISGQDFYQTSYGVVFDSMVELFNEGKPVDLVTLQERLKEKDVPPEISSLEFVRDLVNAVPTSANVKYYAKIVKEKSLMRRLIRTTEEITAQCYQGTDNVEALMDSTEKKRYAGKLGLGRKYRTQGDWRMKKCGRLTGIFWKRQKKRISVLLRGRIWLDMRGRLQRLFCINGTGIIRQMYFLR